MAVEHFVTLFDSGYSSRALALYRSLTRHNPDFTLWVIAMNQEVEDLFKALNYSEIRVIPLKAVETDALEQAKKGRSAGEYCWTLTPFTFDAVFRADSEVERVTYLDADVWLRKSPGAVFQEFSDSKADALITEHAYFPAFDASETSGYFCVQFLTVNRKRRTEVIERWQNQCLDWCFAYTDQGRFGDQGYLNEWPERYGAAVHVPGKKEWFQGPWNAMRFPFGEAIAYHFHSLKIFGKNRISTGVYPIPKPHRRHVYADYVDDLAWAEQEIQSVGMKVAPRVSAVSWVSDFLHRVHRLRDTMTTEPL